MESTVEPLLSGHPLLGGQLLKSGKYSQYNTVNKTSIQRQRPPFGRPEKASPNVFTPI